MGARMAQRSPSLPGAAGGGPPLPGGGPGGGEPAPPRREERGEEAVGGAAQEGHRPPDASKDGVAAPPPEGPGVVPRMGRDGGGTPAERRAPPLPRAPARPPLAPAGRGRKTRCG